ncbi:hypothetical protein [Streptomyces sp. NPDC101455]|uniref:hypothetical protein n=1 Tax=Streptomyces sp. NPDC101455 TaxID=3366142 RepID=UPI0038253C44
MTSRPVQHDHAPDAALRQARGTTGQLRRYDYAPSRRTQPYPTPRRSGVRRRTPLEVEGVHRSASAPSSTDGGQDLLILWALPPDRGGDHGLGHLIVASGGNVRASLALAATTLPPRTRETTA